MFSLITSVIAIVLVVGITVATLYYGGNMFTTQQPKATATTYQNQAHQIEGAIMLYQNDHGGTLPTTMTDLVAGDYLKGIPAGDWSFRDNYVARTGLSADECLKAQQAIGFSTIPLCSVVNIDPRTACCSE